MILTELANLIVNPKAYAQRDLIDNAFRKIRRDNPLAVAEPEGFAPFWVVSKHADIVSVERDNVAFRNGERPTTLISRNEEERVRSQTGGAANLTRAIVQMDNPDHAKYRRLTQGWFVPRLLREREARIREIAKGFVDRMADYGSSCDFAQDIAFLYPLHVIMEVLGVPESDEPLMLQLTQQLFGSAKSEDDAVSPTDKFEKLKSVIAKFNEYFAAITEDRRRNPCGDLASEIANGEIDGQPLGALEALSYYIIVATAGHDTTSSTTASGMLALMEYPDQFGALREDNSLIPGFVEETTRWATPVKHFMRSAASDTELNGQAISKGDWLMLCYPSGNRDEDAFDDPFRFDIRRAPNTHVAYGNGPHVCLGQNLARMEMRIFWEELLPRLKSAELEGEVEFTEANFVSGPKAIPLRFHMS